jgi:hypothetical protein
VEGVISTENLMTCGIDFIFEVDLSAIREPIVFEETCFFKGDGYGNW